MLSLLEQHPRLYNDDKWKNAAPALLEQALLAKFSQNRALLQFLLSTGQSTLGEASEGAFWGIGMRIDNPNVFNVATWKDNTMGRMLEM